MTDLTELMTEPSGIGTDPYYAFGQGQGGAAWKTVELDRKAREEAND